MRRRTFLATVGAGALAGCSALGGKHFAMADDPFSDVTERQTDTSVVKHGLAVIPEGEYATAGINSRKGDTLTVRGQVVKHGPIDLYVMTPDQFGKYKRQPNLVTAEFEARSTSAPDLTADLGKADYQLVMDNTYLGQATPSGEARFQFELEISGESRGTQGNQETANGSATTTRG
ncbi:MAG: hypothetical protein ABEJ31_00375 [Haloarculaceae archaeon]